MCSEKGIFAGQRGENNDNYSLSFTTQRHPIRGAEIFIRKLKGTVDDDAKLRIFSGS